MESTPQIEKYLDADTPMQFFDQPLPGELAAQVVDRLKQEADRHWGIDPRRSLQFAERIITIGRAREDVSQTALGVMARGDALKLLGQTQEAWDALAEAGQLYLSDGNEVGWARTRIGRLYLSTMLQCVAEALADAARAREILIRFGERDKLFRLEFQTAQVQNYLGAPGGAIERYRVCLEIARELGDAGKFYFGYLYLNMGSAFESLGNLSQAQEYYGHAYRHFEAEGETLLLANAEANLGYVAQAQGDYREALQRLHHALEQAADHSDLETTKIKWHLLECYLGLNRRADARSLAREIAGEARQLKDAYELARILLKLAAVEAETGHFSAAHAALDEAEAIFDTLGAQAGKAQARLARGQLALHRGLYQEAYQVAIQTAEVFDAASQGVNLAQAALLQGRAALHLGNIEGAEQLGLRVLATARENHLPSLSYSAHLLLAKVDQRRQREARARRHYLAASASVDRVQRGLTITLRPGFLEDKTEAWRQLIRLDLDAGRLEAAFQTVERSKAGALLGYLGNRSHLRWSQDDPKSQELLSELKRLRGEHQWRLHALEESSTASDHDHPVPAEHAADEIKARELQMRRIVEQLYLHSAGGHQVQPVRTHTPGEILQTLGEKTMLVEYYNDGECFWAFLLARNTLEVQRLPGDTGSINNLLAQFQVNLSAALKLGAHAAAAEQLTALAQRILQRLYALLIAPFEGSLAEMERLIIVPYGALHYLPIHLLHNGSAYGIERFEMVILPAAALALQPKLMRPQGARVLTHTWDGKLPFAEAEGRMVHERFGGWLHTNQQAERSVFKSAPTQILHIAAHGRYRLDQPDLSFIQLSDGQLYADDLWQQDLSYELVTLSACETGRANVSGGEELIGLGRGFLYAGAGALLVSLWPVPDQTTLDLMTRLYQSLQAGSSKAAALRRAQTDLLMQNRRMHPAFWGAFQLVGNAAPLSAGAER